MNLGLCGSRSRTSELNEYLSKFTLDDVILNKLKHPFTKQNFRSFLRERLATENLEFLEEIENMKPNYGKETKDVINLSSPDVIKSIKVENTLLRKHQISCIVESFIIPGSPREINISAKLRNQVLETAHQSTNSNLNISVFDECVSTLTVFALLLFENEIIDDLHLALRIFPCFFLLISLQELYAWKYGFCPLLAVKNSAMKIDDKKSGYGLVFSCVKSEEHKVRYKAVNKFNQLQAMKVFLVSCLICILVGCFIMLIPPTPLV
eukprot:snap_masked-scaffold_129-processed-gene-0.4-mRNA-1 protein AED:0.21 eAED:1.00 QI:0/0/0/1/1/1/2/0/264